MSSVLLLLQHVMGNELFSRRTRTHTPVLQHEQYTRYLTSANHSVNYTSYSPLISRPRRVIVERRTVRIIVSVQFVCYYRVFIML